MRQKVLEQVNASGNNIENHLVSPVDIIKPHKLPGEPSRSKVDYSFYFKCLAGVAILMSTVMLMIGIFVLHPILFGLGAGICGIVAGGLVSHGLFSLKSPAMFRERSSADQLPLIAV